MSALLVALAMFVPVVLFCCAASQEKEARASERRRRAEGFIPDGSPEWLAKVQKIRDQDALNAKRLAGGNQ